VKTSDFLANAALSIWFGLLFAFAVDGLLKAL
jgi:hypothetical protein